MKHINSVITTGAIFLTLLVPPLKTLSSTSIDIGPAFSKSKYYEGIGDYKSAVNVLSQVEQSAKSGYILHVRQGYLWAQLGSLANSEFHYLEASKMNPSAVVPALGLMRIYNQQLRFDKTEALAFRVLKMDINNYYTNVYLTYALRQQNKKVLATKVNQRMLASYPSDPTFLSELALIKFSDDKFEETNEVIDTLFLIDPENSVAKELHYLLLLKTSQEGGE